VATATIPTNSVLARKQWADTALTQHFNTFPLLNVMTPGNGGSTMDGVIIKETFDAGEGDTKDYAFRAPVSINTVKSGDQRIQGTGKSITYGRDTISLTEYGDELQVKNRTMNKQRTKLDVDNDTSKALGEQSSRFATTKVIAALLDVTSGRTQKRYLYGSAESNYNATHATALANVDATDDKLTLSLLGDAITKFRTQSTGLGFMQPAKITLKDDSVVTKYLGLFHPAAIRDLKKDPDFKTSVYQKDNALFDVITGSNFVGEYEGTLIYAMDPVDGENDMLLVPGAGAAGINVAHNLIMGAGAAVIAYGKEAEPDTTIKYSMSNNGNMIVTKVGDDHARDTLWAWRNVMGFKKLVDGNTNEDFGVAHLFTSAKGGL
jgi:N4-gp56 family major capsid protein